jgi:CRISPR/Cas system CMR-associated protein Cmr5 small subunit
MAVDIYDKGQHLDNWLDKNPDALIKYDLYREEASQTINWCHLSTRKPLSARRTFKP